MDLLVLVLVLALIAFLVWLVTTKLPMTPMWAVAIQVITLILVILWVVTRYLPLPNVLR